MSRLHAAANNVVGSMRMNWMIPEVLAVRHNNDDGCGDVMMTSDDDYAMSTSHVLGSTYLFAFLATTFPSIDPGKRFFVLLLLLQSQ